VFSNHTGGVSLLFPTPSVVFPPPMRLGAGNVAVGRPQVADTPDNNSETDLFATTLPWYAVNIHGRREERFADQMRQAGVVCFLPMVRAERRVRRRERGRRHEYRKESRNVPYIPSYAFIAADGNGIYAAKATGLVYSIKPPAIQAKLVRLLIDLRDGLAKPQAPARLMLGRAYEIRSGDLMGKRGKLMSQEDGKCVLRGAILFGFEHDTELDVDLLEAI
jgi:hypothetical protein